jgi:hypothetical protein
MIPFSLVFLTLAVNQFPKRTPSDSLPLCSASVLRTSWLPDLNLNTCISFTLVAFLLRFWASHDSPAFWVRVRPNNLVLGHLLLRLFLQAFSLLSLRLTAHHPYTCLVLANLIRFYRYFHGNDEPSLGHVIDFHPKPALLTCETDGGIGLSHLLQGRPISPAHMGMPSVPSFAFQSSAPFLADRALLVSYALPPPRGVLETFTL